MSELILKPDTEWVFKIGNETFDGSLHARPKFELVRCKDCKHFQPFVGERKKIKAPHKDGWCWNGDCVKLDDFCSEGERRENGHD